MTAHDLQMTRRRTRSAMAEFAQDRHKRAARALGFALTLHDGSAWADFTTIARTRLRVDERAAMAGALLLALDSDEAECIIGQLFTSAGCPVPSFLAPMSDARWWASFASRLELKAFCLSSYEAMCPSDQAAFRRHVFGDRRDAV